MYKFAHLADLHLGAHRHPKLEVIELEKFNEAMDLCMEEKVDFIIISGDVFHIGIPDMSVVNNAVRKLKEVFDQGIPVYVIFGSHDYNPNSDSIINILESAGLIRNVVRGKEAEKGKIGLKFIVDEKTGAKLVGINARKGGVESAYYEVLDRTSLEAEKGFKIFCFHAGLSEFKPPHLASMDTIPLSYLPKGFNYYAGGHIHQRIEENLPDYDLIVYPGPIFGGYARDFEQTAKGERRGFYIVEFDEKIKKTKFIELFGPDSLKYFEFDITGKNSNKANNEIDKKLGSLDVQDKIVLVKIKGELSGGKTSEIKTWNFKNFLISKGALFVDVNKYGLSSKEFEAVKVSGEDIPAIEKKLLQENIGTVKVSYNKLKGEMGSQLAEKLLDILRIDIKTDEKKGDYSSRIFDQAIASLGLEKELS